ncbi:type II toxin-antitoxin system VapC family toxin [Leptospira alexanderi]|uniref:type II toxin-antitoxin system VapC family toxin n=1 Tax=Leptospira alexanderi TaxID=100053 RepID=UPI00028932A0|nr:PIN domain-containing protein [Leptospira alexanderi]
MASKKKVFLDSDVIIDFLYSRPEGFEYSAQVFNLIELGRIQGYISSLIIWNIFYLLKKFLGHKEALNKVKSLRILINILSVDDKIIDLALDSDIKDFEDSIQYHVAKRERIRIFLTRNKKDYPKHDLSILNCEEFIKSLR